MNTSYEHESLADLPDKNAKQFTERLTVAVTGETKRKVKMLDDLGKDVAKILRRAIDAELSKIQI